MQFLKIGHYTHETHATGVSVFLFDRPAPTAYSIFGGSPATHEVHTLELDADVPYIDGLVFTGGSAFGLNAVAGVMRWFKEQGRGYRAPNGPVPIVPAASLYDLRVQSVEPPTAEEAYQACLNATEDNICQGRIGAGAGASVGKLIPQAAYMFGGMGFAELTLNNGVTVSAYAAVNSVGDVREGSRIIAGACWEDGTFANCENYLLSGHQDSQADMTNTTLVAVFTNAKFSKVELKRMSKMAASGMARAISPVFTRADGDIIFCTSLGNHHADEMVISTMAAEAVRQAIVNAIRRSNE